MPHAACRMPRLSLVLVLTGDAMELLYLKSPNAVCFTLLTSDLRSGLHIEHQPSTADLYWNSAWQNSARPSSGPASASPSGFTSTSRSRTDCPTAASTPSPASSATFTSNLTARDIRLWRLASAAAIAAEVALPPAPVVPQTMAYAVAAGIAMHAAFTCLKPRQLITFTGLTTGTYRAFST
ncbi:hypothetical protein [Streptomyces sp. NBC_01185]|uniref:hypothetical protein n=1 Tax=Streptomyces sp. NBC_01185 TaxID=2903764 RepID=UPI00386D6D69|nr:hypothetical protein OG770_00425 [Streptomyces sp. NBC_01185]